MADATIKLGVEFAGMREVETDGSKCGICGDTIYLGQMSAAFRITQIYERTVASEEMLSGAFLPKLRASV